MSLLFISHSAINNAAATALAQWLDEKGYSEVYLDIDPKRGQVAGQRWQQALRAAADRCEAVLFLVSPAWLESKWCLAEFLLAKQLGKRIFGLIIEPVPLDQVPAEMVGEWQLCELVGEDQYRTFDVNVMGRQTQVSFREAGLDLLRRGLERAGLDGRGFAWPPPGEPVRAPYRGLKALEALDAAVFFGRDAWIVRGLDHIRNLADVGVESMLVILGASGSGKSSFLRAGLWPRLLRDDRRFLPLPVVRPQTAVVSGSSGLAVALSSAFERLGDRRALGRVREALATAPTGLLTILGDLSRQAKARLAATDNLDAEPICILALDQAEELFLADGAAEAEALFAMISAVFAVQGPKRLLVIATMRSDRYELLQGEPRLATVKRELFDLPPIAPSEFKSVIEGPAECVRNNGGRLEIDPALTERLIADAQGADALPLLAFTLERLFVDYGSEGRLSLAEYEQLGGVQGSVAAAVSAALAEPGRAPPIPTDKEEQFAALRLAFIPWLARIEVESGTPMRRVARRDDLPEAARPFIDRLVEARLLVADRHNGTDVVEVAHESLLRQWPTLAFWLDADAADLVLIESVERAAGEWERNGSLDAWLDHRGERLAAAERLPSRDDFKRRLGGISTVYLETCRHREDAAQAEREDLLTRERQRLAELETANKRLLEEMEGRQKAQEVIYQAQKLESVGQLIGGVSHDFNNLMLVIAGNLALADKEIPKDNSRLKKLLQNIEKAVQHGERLTSQLLAFSRRQTLASQPIDVNELITNIVTLLERTLGQNITVQRVFGDELWQALGDANQLEMAVLNIAVNARDSMKKGGHILIETANAVLGPPDCESEPPSGEYVMVSVSDSGSGIAPDLRARIFDPFFSTKPVGQGVGLGLSQVLGAMKQLGGGVRLESEVGVGTTVRLYLPRATSRYRPR